MLHRSTHGTAQFDEALTRASERGDADFSKSEPVVRKILEAVRRDGTNAVLRYVAKFEKRVPTTLVRSDYDGKGALGRLPTEARAALEHAAERIQRFHEQERDAMFGEPSGAIGGGFRFNEDGISLGLRVRPLGRVGVYAPGGKARYPSSVLMSAIPARVAGVKDIVLATPLSSDPSSGSDDVVLAAAHLAGVSTVVDAGGAQAIAALAYGISNLARVDKIVGPGNAFVACAKRLVYGAVAIDSIAGPSEILVVADASADPVVVAADLLSQAEHDEDAYCFVVTTSAKLLDQVEIELARQLESLPRKAIAREALCRNGYAFVVADRNAMALLADKVAAEHLSLQVGEAEALLSQIHNAGAAFVGHATPEAAGDYVAGPSHVLPTGGVVRFGSPLGVHDFVARTSFIQYSAEALEHDSHHIQVLARLEGLEAHARAVSVRLAADPEDAMNRAPTTKKTHKRDCR
ncbi:MAG: histidinol dehydrogenase [Polyangiaceae bacterium]|nr:histidinol dehydrogenase [Polyangiaceae bacterium]